MQSVQLSDEGILPLGRSMPELLDGYPLWVTISPNPRTKHKCSIKKKNKNGKEISVICKIPYKMLPQRVQYEYCMRIINRCYLPFLENAKLCGVAELNKSGDIHFHFILNASNVKHDTHLMVLRRDISLCEDVLCNTAASKGTDYMNNICKLTDTIEDRLKYMNKANEANRTIFPNFYLK